MIEIIFFLIMGVIVVGAAVWSWRLDNGNSKENDASSVSEKEAEKEA